MAPPLKTRALALVAAILLTTAMLQLICNYALPGEQVVAVTGLQRLSKDAPLRRLCRRAGIASTSTTSSRGDIQ